MTHSAFGVIAGQTNLSDSDGYSISRDGGVYVQSNCFARWVFRTKATKLYVLGYSTLYATYPDFCEFEIRVNGAHHADLAFGGAQGNFYVALPVGMKVLEIVAGLQNGTDQGASLFGSFLQAVYLSGGESTLIAPTAPVSRLLIYGDSIAVGANADYTCRKGLVQLRTSIPVVFEARGGRLLFAEGQFPSQRADLVTQIAKVNPSIIWMQIGHNDYSSALWSDTDFGAAYAALLVGLHAALPSASIYCQSMTLHPGAGNNELSIGIQAYRDAIAAACVGKSYCTYVNGLPFLAVGDIDTDSVHPTTAGQAKYYAAVKTVLGL